VQLVAGQAAYPLIRFAAGVLGPIVREPALHLLTGMWAEKDTGRHGVADLRYLKYKVTEPDQVRTPVALAFRLTEFMECREGCPGQ
jgi:hypothetical protein